MRCWVEVMQGRRRSDRLLACSGVVAFTAYNAACLVHRIMAVILERPAAPPHNSSNPGAMAGDLQASEGEQMSGDAAPVGRNE